MAKRLKAPAKSAGKDKLARTVRDSAQQIWLAGLGAFSTAQGEGTKVFDALVIEGRTVYAKTREAAGEKLGGVSSTLGKMATNAGNQTTGNMRKLEQVFEQRAVRALNRIVVPINKGIQNLAKRVDRLTANVQRLAGGAPRKTFANKAAARKPAKRKAVK